MCHILYEYIFIVNYKLPSIKCTAISAISQSPSDIASLIIAVHSDLNVSYFLSLQSLSNLHTLCTKKEITDITGKPGELYTFLLSKW